MDKVEQLSFLNHLAIDQRVLHWSPEGLNLTEKAMNPYVYVDKLLSYELADFVPEEIREMFNRARATMSYGIYHYPLFTSGQDAIYLLKEAAIFHFTRCAGLGEPGITFHDLLKRLHDQSYLSDEEHRLWNLSRRIRNYTAHRKSPSLFGPNDALNCLVNAKEMIEGIFVYGPPNYVSHYKKMKQYEIDMKRTKQFIDSGKTEQQYISYDGGETWVETE